MEYVQERVTTLHALRDRTPDAPVDRAAVVVPMTEREHGSLAAERVLSVLESVDPARVVVPLRASPDRAAGVHDWLTGFDLDVETLWCDGPAIRSLLSAHDLNGDRGKGRDVWLGLGRALEEEYVVVHDADARSYSEAYVRRLLFPLAYDHAFTKGYYARVEDGRLYGRLFRLFFRPLVRALADAHDSPLLDYFESFRYALAGEFAATSDLAAELRLRRGWGLEVGTLGDAYRLAGFDRSAQVDLGRYEHDHRSVRGPTGLAEMSEAVADATLRAVENEGVVPDYDALPARYRRTARRLIKGYATDAAFNGLAYDRDDELDQVDAYAESLSPPGQDSRLPAWTDTDLDPDALRDAARTDLSGVIEA